MGAELSILDIVYKASDSLERVNKANASLWVILPLETLMPLNPPQIHSL